MKDVGIYCWMNAFQSSNLQYLSVGMAGQTVHSRSQKLSATLGINLLDIDLSAMIMIQ